MKDRLDELRGYGDEEDGVPDAVDRGSGFSNAAFQEDLPSGLDEFFGQVSRISSHLVRLQGLSEEIRAMQEQVLCSTTVEEVAGGKQRLAELKAEFTTRAREIQDNLARMKEKEGAADARGAGAEGRMRQCQFYALYRRHSQLMGQHYAWEMEYMGRLKEQIARQTQLAGLELGEEEIQQLAEGPLAPRLVGADIQALEALRQLALAQERHQQLLALEQQISELHDLFLSLGVMVSRQQSQVDSIEMNVLRTLDYVSDSTQEVKKALQYQRRSRLAALVSSLLGLCVCCGCLCCASRGLPFAK
ncbi:syntaxin-3-like [Scleropages formosus]|uniref:syntaxin-3-like n=1 Tax=Scleropages formosus TaxID=113540 RepID=UPI0010FACD34|nr:syntaxin-3-like [Scleropages formosus]